MTFSHKSGDNVVTGDFSKLEKLLENLGKKFYVDIGILGEKGSTESGGLTLAGIGAVQEFGTDRAGRGNKTVIPERSFIRMPLETGQDYIEKAIDPKLQELTEKGDIEGIIKLVGIAGEARITKAFETEGFGTWPPNSDITIHGSKNGFIKGKNSDAPLIDTGGLKQSITSKVGGG